MEDASGDLVPGVEAVCVLRKRILGASGSVTLVIRIECIPFPSVIALKNVHPHVLTFLTSCCILPGEWRCVRQASTDS